MPLSPLNLSLGLELKAQGRQPLRCMRASPGIEVALITSWDELSHLGLAQNDNVNSLQKPSGLADTKRNSGDGVADEAFMGSIRSSSISVRHENLICLLFGSQFSFLVTFVWA